MIPSHGDLTGWAKQGIINDVLTLLSNLIKTNLGVLLLNACLTVRAHNANSHSNKGWEQFTDAVIKYFNNNFNNRVFLLWGSYAQKKGSFINQVYLLNNSQFDDNCKILEKASCFKNCSSKSSFGHSRLFWLRTLQKSE